SPQSSAVIPAFFPNPVTGHPVSYPAGYRVVGEDRLRPAPPSQPAAAPSGDLQARLTEARRKLDVSKAYDAVENISSTFGYYLDDFTWDEFVELMAAGGTRPQGAGFYVGREHMYRA